MRNLFFILLCSLAMLQGCFGCGGNKEMMVQDPVETEDERIRRLAIAVARELELTRPQQSVEQPRPAPRAPIVIPAPSSIMPMMPARKAFGIEDVSAVPRLITFMADSATVVSMNPSRFGHVRKLSIVDGPDRWQLKVDSRYDFQEVVAYLRSFE